MPSTVLQLLAIAAALGGEPPTVREAPIRAHLAFLAHDLLEGRGTGQRGGELAVRYLEAQLRALGLEPGAGGGYLQRVDLLGIRPRAGESRLGFRHGGAEERPAAPDEIVFAAGSGEAHVALDAPVVFAGFGIDAPVEGWDDFKGFDCRGKVLLMMVNEPPPSAAEPGRFGGEDLTLAGRWTTKLEEAARRGAAGALLIHTDASATYDWSVASAGFLGERFQLLDGPRLSPLVGWVAEDTARRLVAAGGGDLDDLRRRAHRRDFRPVELDLRAVGELRSEVRRFAQHNVAGVLRGADPALASELVVLSAHWDHLGLQDGRVFNGAVDNASACATLLAIAQAASGGPSRRSLMFLFTAGEEQGLLGAHAYVRAPLWPLAATVAAVNLESLNWVGPAADIEFLGGERSDLLELGARAAGELGMRLQPRAPDAAGLYFRSDHFPFARAGVPALSPGFSLAGERAYREGGERSRSLARTFLDRYHRESDDYDPAWDLRGMVQQGQFVLTLVRLIADAPERPRWRPGGAPAPGR